MSRAAKVSLSPDILKAILGHAEMTARYARDALGMQSVWDMAIGENFRAIIMTVKNGG